MNGGSFLKMKSVSAYFGMLIFLALATSPCQGESFAAVFGLHQTTASTPVAGSSVKGRLNVEFGLLMAFEGTPSLRLKTGSLYKERHVVLRTSAETMSYDFAYIDVPALAQWDIAPSFGLFGGLGLSINVNDKVKVPVGQPSLDPAAKSIITLLTAGAEVTLASGFGADLYFERGLGDYARSIRNFSTFGARVNYWF